MMVVPCPASSSPVAALARLDQVFGRKTLVGKCPKTEVARLGHGLLRVRAESVYNNAAGLVLAFAFAYAELAHASDCGGHNFGVFTTKEWRPSYNVVCESFEEGWETTEVTGYDTLGSAV